VLALQAMFVSVVLSLMLAAAMHSGVAATGRQGALMVTGCQKPEEEQADPNSPVCTQVHWVSCEVLAVAFR